MDSQRAVIEPTLTGYRRRRRAAERGFSLIELMAVVLIVGILATLGITAFTRRVNESNVAHALVVVKAISVAEEHYRAENQVYLNVSPANAWYPRSTIRGNQRASFWNAASDPQTAAWRRLAPDVRVPVQFGFLANAGLPSTDPATVLATGFATQVGVPPGVGIEPWYVIQARADADNDSVICGLVAASWTPAIRSFNDGE